MSTEPKSSIDWEQQRGHVNQDLLRENAELRAGYARARKALGLASEAMNYMGDKASEADIVEDEDIEKTEKAFELAATVLAETPAASLQTIRAEERSVCNADKLEQFFREVMAVTFEGGDWDGDQLQDKAEALGLAHYEPYDPAKHDPRGCDIELGDPVLVLALPIRARGDGGEVAG